MPVQLTPKQVEANRLLGSSATYIFLWGGSRSGKTFLWIRAMCLRAMKAPGSRHVALRFRNNAIKQSIVMDTFPKVMALCFPEVEYKTNMADMFARFPNGSEIWFGGLDDKERVEKILGNEYATMAFNECSQIPYSSILMALTRLAQKCTQEVNGKQVDLPLKVYFDANPPNKSHWTHKMFILRQNPDTRQPLAHPELYCHMQLNPRDNMPNLPSTYITSLEAMPERMKRRFLYGEFGDDNPNALFSEISIDKWRKTDGGLPDMVRIVIGVDPSGSGDDEATTNDPIGIVVVGLGTDGITYVIEDLTVKAGPATWGRVAVQAYERHQADIIVGESNYGGEMVRFVIKTADPMANYRKVTASRGKTQRAEPFSPLFEDGRVRFAGYFPEMEEELMGFSTQGYTGERSPNRADALMWALAELFHGIVKPRKEKTKSMSRPRLYVVGGGGGAWMS
jgi:phage terminase large subunit-like protein